jgi:hypothetical protein
MKKIYSLILLVIINSTIIGQGFLEVSSENLSIDNVFNSIFTETNEDIFIGYSITTNMENMFSIGSYYIDDEDRGFSLREIIDNPNKYNLQFENKSKEKNTRSKKHRFRIIMNGNKNDLDPDPETAIILHYSKGNNNSNEFNDIFSLQLSLECRSWLG